MGDNDALFNDVINTDSLGIGRNALLLVLTESGIEEQRMRIALEKHGYRCVATEVGGSSDGEYQIKLTRAVIGAALNTSLIGKDARSIHALLHASEEAKRGFIVNVSSNINLTTKVAIVRNDHWLGVALFGTSSLHPYSNHERVGLGIMHLP